MKTYEKNDVSSAVKRFARDYVLVIIAILALASIIFQLSDVSITGMTTIRAIVLFVTVILASKRITKEVIKKFQITKLYKDNLKFNINLIIIAVAILSIFYFLITLNNNINKFEESSEYRLYEVFVGEEQAKEMLVEAEKEARKSFIILWVSILAASAVAIATEEKTIEKYCLEDETERTIKENVE